MMLNDIYKLKPGKRTARVSSWDKTGGNADFWTMHPGETLLMADIQGPAIIKHIWSSFNAPWREMLFKFTWDDAEYPSIDLPFGDFFCLGHGIVNSFNSAYFSASTASNNKINKCCKYYR